MGTMPDRPVFLDRGTFLDRVIKTLGTRTCDFQDAFHQIASPGKADHHRRAAGVLLPVFFRENDREDGGFFFQVIKRSSVVAQPGDLSLPGGMLNPVLDRLLRVLMIYGPFGILRGNARSYLLGQPLPSAKLVTLFLANALREAWEEIRLSPTRVHFLGPLPTYNLTLFQRTIFPLVGFVEGLDELRPNKEVEKVLEIPMSYFTRDDVYGVCRVVTSDGAVGRPLDYPCLIYREPDGGEEILWGATFHIICTFLEITASWHLPEWRTGRIVYKHIDSSYLNGIQ